jgi:drug/metabolite transporter (DMT)-like permease
MLKPDMEIFKDGTVWGILAGIASAVGLTSLRQLNLKGEPFERTMFYLFLVSVIVSCPFAIANWQPISWHDSGLICLLGICILINNLLLTRAFQYAPASYLAPMSYLTVLFNGLLGWVLFQNSLDFITFSGGMLILAGTSLTYFLNDRQSLKPN